MRTSGTIQIVPRLLRSIGAQSPNWIEEQKAPFDYWDFAIGLVALTCGVGSILLACIALAVMFE